MNEEISETKSREWNEAHPWLSLADDPEERESLDEVILYTLDELRLA